MYLNFWIGVLIMFSFRGFTLLIFMLNFFYLKFSLFSCSDLLLYRDVLNEDFTVNTFYNFVIYVYFTVIGNNELNADDNHDQTED